VEAEPKYRIISLEIENYKRIKAVFIRPKRAGLTIIAGRNAQGKSTVLDAIAAALGGRGYEDEEPLRRGAVRGSIKITLGVGGKETHGILRDEKEIEAAKADGAEIVQLIIEKKITAKGTYLEVRNAPGGKPLSSPQAILDALKGGTSFDALAFARMSPKEQEAVLRRVTGLDFTDLEKQEAEIREQRTTIGRSVKQAEAVLASMPRFPDAPLSEISLLDLSNELEGAGRHNADVRQFQAVVERWTGLVREGAERQATCSARVREIQATLDRAKAELNLAADELSRRQENLKGAVQAAAEAKPVDTGAIQARMVDAQETNKQVRANLAHKTSKNTLATLTLRHADLETALEKVATLRQERLLAVNMPIKGLGFSPLGVTFNDLPIAQAAESEKLKVSVAIGAALNSRLRTITIHDGEKLDDDGMAFLEQFAEEHDLSILIERVGTEEGEAAVVIEDGEVRPAEVVKAKPAGKAAKA
jgi:chromosome segregation ATPase